jgi:hypothetical protein
MQPFASRSPLWEDMDDTNNLDYLENVSNEAVIETVMGRFQAGYRCTQVGRSFVLTAEDQEVGVPSFECEPCQLFVS